MYSKPYQSTKWKFGFQEQLLQLRLLTEVILDYFNNLCLINLNFVFLINFKIMATILAKIADIEAEMARTQKNKATEGHLGLLKAKLAKLKREITDGPKASGGGQDGFDVKAAGDARVGLIGFPSVGKSTLLSKLTGTFSEAADYEFTTLTCIPGVYNYKGTKV